MATSDYWSSADLKGIVYQGHINEDVMQQIWDITDFPLPFSDRVGSDTVKNAYSEWVIDELAAPVLTNKAVDGQDVVTNVDGGGAREGNHTQIATKRVTVTSRARASDTIGRADELGYMVMQRQKELRRDVEAQCLSALASVADDGDSVAGQSAGLDAWLKTNTVSGTLGTDGGFNGTTPGIVDAPTAGTALPLAVSDIQAMAQACYVNGGNPSCLMGVPTVIGLLSRFMFTTSANIATIQADQHKSKAPATALGAVNVFVTDFNIVLEFEPNRIQQNVTTDESTLFLIDSEYLRIGYLHGYRVEPLAKLGLADPRLMSVDYTLKVTAEKAHALIREIDNTAAILATPA